MSCSSKTLKNIKFGLTGSKKKFGINYWRFFFNAFSSESSVEQFFYIEFEMLNPWISSKEVQLGYRPRVKIQEEDLQYALAGTDAAKNLQTEDIVQPSYCVIRVGKLGEKSKQLCSYFPVKDIVFNPKRFELEIGNKYFSGDKISGFLNVNDQTVAESPELMCDAGNANWNINYEIINECNSGAKKDGFRWFPAGLKTNYSGKINFDGIDYLIDPKRCCGYMDRYWGKSFPNTWFHISSANLVSQISGKHLFNSSFVSHGAFDNKVCFSGILEGLEINFNQTENKNYSVVWSCVQAPVNESDTDKDNKLHWSVSLNNKNWIVDIDLYCKVMDLYNRKIELPQGDRKILSVIEGGNCTGEIRLYKHGKNSIEQIEYAKIEKAFCQYGLNEDFDF